MGQLESGSEFPYKPVFPLPPPSKTKEEDKDFKTVCNSVQPKSKISPNSISASSESEIVDEEDDNGAKVDDSTSNYEGRP